MAGNVLKEFLVSLNYRVDGSSEQKFVGSVRKATLEAKLLGDALEGALRKLGGSMSRIAETMESMYYMSQRTGASVTNIKAFGYAASQMGASVDQASSSIANFSRTIKSNPGYEGLLKSFGISTRDAKGGLRDTSQMLKDFGRVMAGKPQWLQFRYAQMFGIDDDTLRVITKGYDKFLAEFEKKRKAAGLDPNAAAENATRLQNAWRSMSLSLGNIAERVFQNLTSPGASGKSILDTFTDFLDKNSAAISQVITDLATSFLKLTESLVDMLKNVKEEDIKRWGQEFHEMIGKIDEWAKKLEWIGLFIAGAWATNILLGFTKVGVGFTGLLARFGLLGLGGVISGGIGTGLVQGQIDKFANESNAGSKLGGNIGEALGGTKDTRNWWQKIAPKILGGKDAPGEGGAGTEARKVEAYGKYRPIYKLGDKDLSDHVVNTIAGEASTKNPEGIDAVINNMLNRVGTRAWGPSGNLEEVARAPGQYAGYSRATAKQAELIRSRIRAIATGGIPDNTHGSNSYRAAWYAGPWAQKHMADGVVIGGNRFGHDPAANGPYAPYKNFNDPKPLGSWGAPAGASSTNNNNNVNQTTKIEVHGVSDPFAAAQQIGWNQKRLNGDLIRNMQGATQ